MTQKNSPAFSDGDPLWYKDAIIYEVHVRAFADSNADGIGDFRGLVDRLDYLQDLGVTALWLLPFYPSPLRDDGYDIADYNSVNPIYGDLADFKLFLREAHKRGLRVITELVVNHTSDQHPWFQRARIAPVGSSWRDFYVWSDTPEKYKDARIIFGDFEGSNWTWDPVAKAYFWHRFYSHQPDLNYDNPAVQEAVIAALDFWLGMGIDGLRLDAVPYLYEREGTNCENLPETHAFLKKLRRHVDEHFENRLLLAEANQWPEDAVAYFGDGDECQMSFHFPLMPRLFMAIHMEDRFPIIDILQQTPPIPDNTQWALFLRNHDELTLEMVTDEDRDYMVRVYAQDAHARINLGIRRRLAPLLENHRGKIELMNGLLFSLPGTPVLYYGDEIGMGDNIYLGDRNGVRTPMQWNPERNAGFSRANPQRLYLPIILDPEYHYQTVNVEADQNNPHSLLWWMKRMIGLRKRYKAFGRGTLEFLTPSNRKVLGFIRHYAPPHSEQPGSKEASETVLVVANLSRFVQYAELDLSAYAGQVLVEMLGQTHFPKVGDRPYLLTLGPYDFFWFRLEHSPAGSHQLASQSGQLPSLEADGAWESLFQDYRKHAFEGVLLAHLRRQPWFLSPGEQPRSAMLFEVIPIPSGEDKVTLCLVQVEYAEGEPRNYLLPLAYAHGAKSDQIKVGEPQTVVCEVRTRSVEAGKESQAGILYDPLGEKVFTSSLLEAIAHQRRFEGMEGDVQAWSDPSLGNLGAVDEPLPETALWRAAQGTSLVTFGDRFLLKVFRYVDEGVNPVVEIGQALAEKTTFAHAAPVAGGFTYRPHRGKPMTLAALMGFIPHQGDLFRYTVDTLHRFFVRILTGKESLLEPNLPGRSFLDLVGEEMPQPVQETIGAYLETARLAANVTAEMHLALASITDDPAFTPEPFTVLYQRSLFQTSRTRALRVFELLEQARNLPDDTQRLARRLLTRKADLLTYVRSILDQRITAQRIRCHCDYQLSHLLSTGKDLVVIGFEGETNRPLSNRRHKRSPLRDVASLFLSLFNAGQTALKSKDLRPEDITVLIPWARFWHRWVAVAFAKTYLQATAGAGFLPKDWKELQTMLDFYLLGRGIATLRNQLLNQPDEIEIPLAALLHLLELRDRRGQTAPPAKT